MLTCGLQMQLEAFLERWRAELKPSHSFVFTMRNGAPMTVQGVHRLFVSACYRLVRPCRPVFRSSSPVEPILQLVPHAEFLKSYKLSQILLDGVISNHCCVSV